jgi:hypothetical protein
MAARAVSAMPGAVYTCVAQGPQRKEALHTDPLAITLQRGS